MTSTETAVEAGKVATTRRKDAMNGGGDGIPVGVETPINATVDVEKPINAMHNVLAGKMMKAPPPKMENLESLKGMSNDQLIDKCKQLMAEVDHLRKQVDRKEEQKQTAVKLLRHLKKKQSEGGIMPTLSQALKNAKDKEGDKDKPAQDQEADSPKSQAGSVASHAPSNAPSLAPSLAPSITHSVAPSIMSLGRRSVAGGVGYRRPMGLRELVDPDVRLAQVLDKLSSEPILTSLEEIVDKLVKTAAPTYIRGSRK